MNMPKLWTKNFLSLTLSNLFLFITYYYLLVALPIYALQELSINESNAGFIVTIFLISAIFIRPLTGKWMELLGKRNVFLFSLVLFAVASAFYLLSKSMAILLVIRFIQGIGFGMATTAAGTMVADTVPDSRKGEGMGYFVLSNNFAIVIGPYLGLTVMNHLGGIPMIAVSVLFACFAFLSGWFTQKIPETSGRESEALPRKHRRTLLSELADPSAVRISIVAGLLALSYSSILSFEAVYAREMNLEKAGSYFFVVFAIILIMSRPFTGKWFDQYGANIIIYPAICCFSAGLLLFSQATTTFLFLLSAAFIGLGWGTLFPSFQTIAVQLAEPHKRGLATATFLSIFDLGIGVGSYFAGLISSAFGFHLLYISSSLLAFIGISFYFFLYGRFAMIKQQKNDMKKRYPLP